MQEDGKIIELIQTRGSMEEGFRLLLHTYQEKVYWQIRRMVYNHEDANDVMQNTFIKIYKGIAGFKGNSGLYTWIYRIASNETISFLKKKQKHLSTPLEDGANSELAQSLRADPYFDGDEIEINLQEALSRLPEKQRLVFNMRYYEDLGYKQMSEILDTSVGALKASYHHAVKKIEGFIKEKVE